MAGNSIQGIAKTMLQARANLKIEAASKDAEQDVQISFMELMNQSNLSNSVSVSTGSDEMEIGTSTADTAKTVYDSTSSAQKNVSVKQNVNAKTIQSEKADEFSKYEEEIRKVLKDELGVTDEEIEAAMESLGFGYLDLRNMQNLSALVQNLTGMDIGTLFLSESFQNIMNQVSTLTEQLCQELGITAEELTALCEELKQMEEQTSDAMTLQQNEDASAMTASGVSENFDAGEEIAKNQVNVSLQQTEEETVTEENLSDNSTENVESMETAAMDETTKEQSMNQGEQSSSENSKNAEGNNANVSVSVMGGQTVTNDNFVIPQEAMPGNSQVNVADLIDQIARNVRVTITAETTSMEMQLNPENLGKIYLNVSERDGVIRAQIAAQNETVKEALETQLVELRQSLNQQGVKVDAIEVTVATHEFEQNLEGNAKQEEEMQKQMEEHKKNTRRNLNLNDLDGLSGLMSEEEQLAAQIMKDNGNQVDLTA